MSLLEQTQITPGDCVAVVGAGGKTTLCWRLVQELAGRGERVVFTTTTHIRQPAPGAFDVIEVTQESGAVEALLSHGSWRTACIASAYAGEQDDTPVPHSTMPVVHTKLKGFSGNEICDLRAEISNLQSPISFIVEADGARGQWLKAPAEHEPVIPHCANVVCVVANLQALDQPLDEHVAHRPELIAQLTGVAMGQPITWQLLIDLLTHPQGGLKGIPSRARTVAVLTRKEGDPPLREAAGIARELIVRGFDHAITL